MRKSVILGESIDPSYMYIGNHLIFEPEFTRSFKHKEIKKEQFNKAEYWDNSKVCTRL